MNVNKTDINRVVGRMLCIVLLGSVAAICSAQFAGGDGSQNNPWQIATAEHLNNIRNYLGIENQHKYYVQTRDINLGTPPWNEGEGWNPIGPSRHEIFYGNYDGGGFVIKELTINRPNSDYQALFGYTAYAEFKNVGLREVNITGGDNVAGLIARIDDYTTVDRCYVTGNVRGSNVVAGLVAHMRGSDPISHIIDCYSTAGVTTTNTGDYHNAGGIVAYRFRGSITRNYATGFIDTPVAESVYVGAILGRSFGGAGEISHNYWNLDTTGVTRGGYIQMPGSTLSEMLQQNTYEGFDFGNVWHVENGFSYPFLQWEGENAAEHNRPLVPPIDFRGVSGDQTVNLYWTAPDPEVAVPDGYNIYRDNIRINDELIDDREFEDSGVNNWEEYTYYATALYGERESSPSRIITIIPNQFAGGRGTAEDPWQIETAEQLHRVRTFLGSEYSDMYFIQISDIDLNIPPWNEDEGWQPIGPGSGEDAFQANYDGSFYTIMGLTINRGNEADQALFGTVDGNGFLKGIIMTDVTINTDGTGAGGIVGYLRGEGKIYKCAVDGSIVSSNQGGGIAGRIRGDSKIIRCFSTGEVRSTSSRAQVGGITGMAVNSAAIANCYSTMTVTGGERRIGGLVGSFRSDGRIINSYSTGLVRAVDEEPSEIGGLVGQEADAEAVNSYWNIETSRTEQSALGEGRLTRQMTYPYDEETFIDWDFETIWQHDPYNINNNYPILAYQLELIDPLDTPQVTSEIIAIDGTDYISLTWEAIEDAVIYRIYSSEDPYAEDWGEPVVTEEISYREPVNNSFKKFFRVIASAQ